MSISKGSYKCIVSVADRNAGLASEVDAVSRLNGVITTALG